tara:strand:+ start:205 stop:336 length:132 start_codon:yes stop_codon:yes gene_type:complete
MHLTLRGLFGRYREYGTAGFVVAISDMAFMKMPYSLDWPPPRI